MNISGLTLAASAADCACAATCSGSTAPSSVGRRLRSVTKLVLEWYWGVCLLLQQRSKHPREMFITPKASTSNLSILTTSARPSRAWSSCLAASAWPSAVIYAYIYMYRIHSTCTYTSIYPSIHMRTASARPGLTQYTHTHTHTHKHTHTHTYIYIYIYIYLYSLSLSLYKYICIHIDTHRLSAP